MKDIDRLFSDKLKHHQQSPPVSAWDKMDAALDASAGRRRKSLLWSIAATVSLLLLGGMSLWYSGTLENHSHSLAIEIPETETNQSLHEVALPLLSDHFLAPAHQAEKLPAPVQKEPFKEEVQQPLTAQRQERDKTSSQPNQPEVVLAEAETSSNIKPAEVPELLDKLIPENRLIEQSAPLAQMEAPRQVTGGITLIYKPGDTEATVQKANPLAFLDELKNSGISMAELRNAKSDLLAKVFSKKEELLND